LCSTKKKYDLDVTQVGAAGTIPHGGISIIETDVAVDFAPPADMPIPSSQASSSSTQQATASGLLFDDDPNPDSSSSDEDDSSARSGSIVAVEQEEKKKQSNKPTAYVGAGFKLANGNMVGERLMKPPPPKPASSTSGGGSESDGGKAGVDHFGALKGQGNKLKG